MRVLGLNGWPGRGHDAAAAVVQDGRIAAFAEEERFVRQKHAYGHAAHHAAAFALAQAGCAVDDLDAVAFGWDVPALHKDRGLPWALTEEEALEALLPAALFPRTRSPRLTFVPHHIAHAASAYHVSGDDRAAVLVLDGQGENESASLGVADNGKIRILETVPVSWSLGYFYDAVGRYMGLGRDQAGKVMGLAAYGDVTGDAFGAFVFDGGPYRLDGFDPALRSSSNIDDSAESVELWLRHLESVAALPPNGVRSVYDPGSARFRRVTDRDPFDYRDLAANAQSVLERAVGSLVDRLFELTDSRTLHVSGGVGFNATLNGLLIARPDVERLFVQPVAGDAGVALGAALHLTAEYGRSCEPMRPSVALGPEFAAADVRSVLDDAGLRYEEPADIAEAVAALVADDRIVGWFQGPGEVGPRALGHRSILANPARERTRNRINLEIKRREWWRPLAPSVTAESLHDIVDTPADLPYMVVTRPVRQDVRERLAAVTHVDGSTRPQSVHRGCEPLYHRFLSRLGEATGLPVALNTSFNDNTEPIVWTPADAVRTFARTGLDALAVGPFLIRKR